METFPWLLTYDNINIPFRVFSQRLDNQSKFGNATAATVYIKQSATPLSQAANRNLQETRAEGLKNPLSSLDIMSLTFTSYPHIDQQANMKLFEFSLMLPILTYHTQTYKYKDSPLLRPPIPLHQLPSSKAHVTLQFLLGTVNH